MQTEEASPTFVRFLSKGRGGQIIDPDLTTPFHGVATPRKSIAESLKGGPLAHVPGRLQGRNVQGKG